jgi:DNA-binding protein HU-beta
VNKTEFVSKIAKTTDLSGAEAGRVVQAVLDAGFGKFSVSQRAARTGVNPQDPTKKVQIPARRVPRFTPGAVLKQSVAGS